MARRDTRVVILMSEEEYVECKERAGIASVGAYIREVLAIAHLKQAKPWETGNYAEHRNPDKDVPGAKDVLPAERSAGEVGGRKEPDPGSWIATCEHHKKRGEMCYKCDPKWGYPKTGEP
jgi:hypothetical protein